MILDKCLACNFASLIPVLDLGDQPLANSFSAQPNPNAETFPLKINHCTNCTHSQLDETIDPKKLFSEYCYVSGTTKTLKKHFEDLSYDALKYYNNSLKSDSFQNTHLVSFQKGILEIGCNDCSLLKCFADDGYGHHVEGVDPANNLRPLSKEKGIPVLVDFWNSETALKMRKSSYDVILALNCLGHVPDPYDFLLGCTRVLSPAGVVIIEVPYLVETLERHDLGQFYHEHHSYFTVQSMMNLVERVNLHIAEIGEFPEIHGGTLRFVLRRGNGPHCPRSRNIIADREMAVGFSMLFAELIKEEDLDKLACFIYGKNNDLMHNVAYGASAKSTVLFNLPYLKSRNFTNHIAYVIDDAPLKQDKFCPGTTLKINSPEVLKDSEWEGVYPDLNIIITVHNFKAEVIKKLKSMNLPNKVRIINYTPHFSIENLEDL